MVMHRSLRRARNPISTEYLEELLATGIVVPLDVNPAFFGSLMRAVDALERSKDSAVAFLVATGRFQTDTSAILVFPDLEAAAKVRTAAAYLAGDQSADMILRVRALDLIRLIEEATSIEKIAMRYEPSRPPEGERSTSMALRPRGAQHGLLRRPTATSRRRAMRLLTDAHGDSMKGVLAKFPSAFKKGYAFGWMEYDANDVDGEAGDRWGQHINGLEQGLVNFAILLEKSGFETTVYDVCGCGDPLHLTVVFRRPGESTVLGIQVWDGLWHDEGSYDLNEDLCVDLAEGDGVLPDDAWTVVELPEMDDDEWSDVIDGAVFNPRRSARRARRSCRSVRPRV